MVKKFFFNATVLDPLVDLRLLGDQYHKLLVDRKTCFS